MRSTLKILVLASLFAGALLGTVLLVPPVRYKFFTTKLWPWPLPWDVSEKQLAELKGLCQPGDVIVESNLHGWQWIALSWATTGTAWVHAALVDDNKRLLTVETSVIETGFEIYRRWGSTRLALVRLAYRDARQAHLAIEYARSKLGTNYDPSFREHAGNCNGLVASALYEAGLAVPQKTCLGVSLYAPDCFLQIPSSQIIWSHN